VPPEFTDPVNDSIMQAKNAAFSSFLDAIQTQFGSNDEIDFKIALLEKKLDVPFSRLEWRQCKLDEIFVNQMKDIINKIKPTEIECHQIAKYNENAVQKIDLDSLKKRSVNLAHQKYLSELIKMTKAKCNPDKKIEELSVQSVKLEEMAAALDLDTGKAETRSLSASVVAFERKKTKLRSIQDDSSSLTKQISDLKCVIDQSEQDQSSGDQNESDGEKIKDLSKKYNFYIHGGCFYFLSGYLKYCPQSNIFSYNSNVMDRPAWIFHLKNLANTQHLIKCLVELVISKINSITTLREQADVINIFWSQLERLIKSYHLALLRSTFPPQLKIQSNGFDIVQLIKVKAHDDVVKVEWSFQVSQEGLELKYGKQISSYFNNQTLSELVDPVANSLDINQNGCLEKCIKSISCLDK